MAQLTELFIVRPMSTPLQIRLVGEDLPAPVRQALADVVTTQAELKAAQHVMGSVSRAEWGNANERVTAAAEAAGQAVTDFAGVGAASSSAIRDSAAASFATAMDRAAGHLRDALAAMEDANRAALLWHAVKPGKPVLRYETDAGRDTAIHKQLGIVRSDARDLLSQLPDSLD